MCVCVYVAVHQSVRACCSFDNFFLQTLFHGDEAKRRAPSPSLRLAQLVLTDHENAPKILTCPHSHFLIHTGRLSHGAHVASLSAALGYERN